MNLCNISKTFADYKAKGWDRIYVLVDVHGTIIPSGEHEVFSFIHEDAKVVLQWFSERPEVRLILWTSSYLPESSRVCQWLAENGISIAYINSNPEAKDTARACFARKPYYNIVIDDRAGFEPATDWTAMRKELTAIAIAEGE